MTERFKPGDVVRSSLAHPEICIRYRVRAADGDQVWVEKLNAAGVKDQILWIYDLVTADDK